MTFHENQVNLYFALKNPIRCWIIQLLNSNKGYSSSDLAQLLHINLSRCCYHLDNLSCLVKQDDENRYFLSIKGIRAFEILRQHI